MKRAALRFIYSLTRMTGLRRMALLAGIALLTFSCNAKKEQKSQNSDSSSSDSVYDTCYKSVQPMNKKKDSIN